MRVGLMAPGFNPYDAVGNDLLGMFTALLARGDQPTIFTPTGETDAAFPVMHYADAEFLLDRPDDVLIYHFCVADPFAFAILRRQRCRVIVRYHNVTPASMMSRYSAAFGRTCRLGREMLTLLPDMAIDAFFSASHYNASELLALGIEPERSHVLPPLHQIDDLVSLPDHEPTVRQLETNTYNLLAVGRLVPNKNFGQIADAFGKAVAATNLDIRLHHIGFHDPRLQTYIDEVVSILEYHGVRSRFTFHGQVDPHVIATLYRHVDLFCTTSLHEGFCVPAVEAMAFSRPILSSRYAALPETCGDVATYADTSDEFAARIAAILSDDTGRIALGRRTRARYDAHFRGPMLRRRFLDTLDAALHHSEMRISPATLDHDGDWFYLPHSGVLLGAALPAAPPGPPFGLAGQDRRRDLVDWVLREGWIRVPALAAYLRTSEFRDYACGLQLPTAAQHLDPVMRLVWTFHRPARSRFDLQSTWSVAEFRRWYGREATGLYIQLQPTTNLVKADS